MCLMKDPFNYRSRLIALVLHWASDWSYTTPGVTLSARRETSMPLSAPRSRDKSKWVARLNLHYELFFFFLSY